MKKAMNKIKMIVLLVFGVMFNPNVGLGSGIGDSNIAKGTENLIQDASGWIMVLAPALTILMIGYYFLRKSSSDEMDHRKWDTRIKIAIVSCIGVIVTAGLINVIISYYK